MHRYGLGPSWVASWVLSAASFSNSVRQKLHLYFLSSPSWQFLCTFYGEEKNKIKLKLFIFTLYRAYIEVGIGDLVIRHFVPMHRQIIETLPVYCRNSTPPFALLAERGMEILNISFPQVRIEFTTVYRVYSHILCCCNKLVSQMYNIINIYQSIFLCGIKRETKNLKKLSQITCKVSKCKNRLWQNSQAWGRFWYIFFFFSVFFGFLENFARASFIFCNLFNNINMANEKKNIKCKTKVWISFNTNIVHFTTHLKKIFDYNFHL